MALTAMRLVPQRGRRHRSKLRSTMSQPTANGFVILDRPGGEQPLSIHVVHNWFEEFRNRTRK